MRENTSTRLKQIMREQNLKQIDILNKSLPFQKKLGVKMGKSALSQYVSGKSNPDQQKLVLLAKTLDVSEPWLMGFEVEKKKSSLLSLIKETSSQLTPPRQQKVYDFAKNELEEQQLKNKTSSDSVVQFPVSASTDQYDTDNELQEVGLNLDVAAGYGTVNYNKTQIIDTVFVRRKDIPSDYDLVARVNGDSMKPTFEDNEIIFIKQTSEINNGMIAALEINDLAYLKKVYMENGRMRIVSLNDEVDQYGERIYPDFYADEHDEIYIIGKVVI